MVVVQVGEQEAVYLSGVGARFEQAAHGARAAVEEQFLFAQIDQIARAGAVYQRRGGARAQQGEGRCHAC